MIKFRKILPFLGISLICTYWLAIFDSSTYIKDTLFCYNSIGYDASRDLYSKKEMISLISNCSEIHIDPNSIVDIKGPEITYYFHNSPPFSTNMNNFETEFEKHVSKANRVAMKSEITVNAPKFRAHFTKLIDFRRYGVLFSVYQIITMEQIDVFRHIFVRYIVSALAFFLLFFHKRRKRNVFAFTLSTLTILMHVMFFGRYLQTFRIIATFSWLIEFLNMLNLKIRGFSIVIPVILLTLACAMTFYGIFMTHSKWFKDVTTSTIVTISLMVGDHVQETMTSLHGHSLILVFRFVCSGILVLILTFIIMASIGKPFNKLVSQPETQASP